MAKDYSNIEGLIGNVKESIRNAYDKGYKQGFNEGFNDGKAQGRNEGLFEAWECAKMIVGNTGALSCAELTQIFGLCDLSIILNKNSASEAIAKIKEYEEKAKQADDEIKVGDEILIHNIQDAETYKAVVMDIDMDKGLWIFDENACNTVIEPNRYIGEEADIEVRKTGRTFPQIAEVLGQLKEAQNETK